MVAVVAALELDDLLAAGEATGDADGVHRCFGAASCEKRTRSQPKRRLISSARMMLSSTGNV